MTGAKRRALGVSVLFAALAVSAFAVSSTLRSRALQARLLRADDPAADAELVAAATSMARPLFSNHCAGCHGADMRGDRARGTPALTANHWLHGTGEVAQIERTILHGVRAGDPKGRNLADMPAFGRETPYARETIPALTPDQIDDAMEFVLTLRGSEANSQAAARGAVLYAGAGGCADCHAGDGKGDPVVGAPDLALSPGFFTDGARAGLRDIIANGHAGICPAWRGRLDVAEIRALAVYVQAVARGVVRVGEGG